MSKKIFSEKRWLLSRRIRGRGGSEGRVNMQRKLRTITLLYRMRREARKTVPLKVWSEPGHLFSDLSVRYSSIRNQRLITSVLRFCFIQDDVSGISAIPVHSRRMSVQCITTDRNQTIYSHFTSFFMHDNHRPGFPLGVDSIFRTSSPSKSPARPPSFFGRMANSRRPLSILFVGMRFPLS